MNTHHDETAARFREIVSHQVNDKAIPSISYVLVDRDGPIAMGHVQPDGHAETVTDSSVFRIGSLTKMFTTLCLMQLAEQGLVDIDADIHHLHSAFHARKPVRRRAGGEPWQSRFAEETDEPYRRHGARAEARSLPGFGPSFACRGG